MAQELTAAEAAKAIIDVMESSGESAEQVIGRKPELKHGGTFLGVTPQNRPVARPRGSGSVRLSR